MVSPYAVLAAEPAIEGSGTWTFSQTPNALDFTTDTLNGEKAEEHVSVLLINTTTEKSETQIPSTADDPLTGEKENASAPLIHTTVEELEDPTSNAAEDGTQGTESTPLTTTDVGATEEQTSSGEESLPDEAEDQGTTAANTPPIFNLGDDVTVEEDSGEVDAPPIAKEDDMESGEEGAGDSIRSTLTHLTGLVRTPLLAAAASSEWWFAQEYYTAVTGLGSDDRYAQTFIPPTDGAIGSVWLYIYPAVPIDVTVQVRGGTPNSPASGETASATKQVTANGWQEFVLSPPMDVIGGSTYYFQITGGGASTAADLFFVPADVYSGGTGFGFDSSAGWWDAGVDFTFRISEATHRQPVLTINAGLTLNQGTTGIIAKTNLEASDPDGDAITYTIGTLPVNGTLKYGDATLSAGSTFTQDDIDAGLITYVHDDSRSKSDSFTFTLSDGEKTLAEETFNITVKLRNLPPNFTLGPNVTVFEDAGPQTRSNWAADITPGADEPEQTVTFIVTADDPSLFSEQPAVSPDGTLTFTPGVDKNGQTTVRVRAVDDGGTENGGSDTSGEKSFTITIVAVNNPPVAKEDWDWGTDEDSGEIRIMIAPLANDKPGPDTATDEAGQTLSLTGVTNGTGGTVRLNGGKIYFTPAPNFHGNASFQYTVQDSEGATATGTVYVLVSPVADKPVVVGDTEVAEDDQITFSLQRAAVDGEEVTHFIFSGIENGKLYRNGGATEITGGYILISQASTVVFVPDPDFNGEASFTVRTATSAAGKGLSEETRVLISVTPVNDPPMAVDDVLSPVSDVTAPVEIPFASLLDNDSPGPANEGSQTLTITGVGHAVGGTVEIEGTNVLFTVSATFNGTASFTYTVADDGTPSMTDEAAVSFSVSNTAKRPVVTGTSTPEDTLSSEGLMITPDPADAARVTHFVITGITGGMLYKSHGVTVISDGGYITTAEGAAGLRFLPLPDQHSLAGDSFGFTVQAALDAAGSGISSAADVTITVTEVNDAPVAQDQSLSAAVGTPLSGSLDAADVENDPLTFVLVGPPAHGRVSIKPDGSFTYTGSQAGLDSFTFKASDGDLESNVATVTVQVSEKPSGGGGAKKPKKPSTEPAEQPTEESPVVDPGVVTPEGSSAAPVRQQVTPGEPAEARMGSFQVSLPGEVIQEPLHLQVLSPSANTAAVALAEEAAEFAGTGDGELISQADGTPVSEARATVTFAYDPGKVSDPAALGIFYFDAQQNVWVEIGGEVNSETHTIAAQVNRFTTFAALVPQADAPVLSELPAAVQSSKVTISGTAAPGTPVTLVINEDSQVTVMTDENGQYSMEGMLAEGSNTIYVKGTGALASREWPLTYQPASGYTDIGGHWAEETIKRLAEIGITTMYAPPSFDPDAKVTRLEFAVKVARVLGLTPVEEPPTFADTVVMPKWALPKVAAAHRAGIIQGMPDGSFAPDRLVNRAEMAVMLTRALEYAGKDTTPGDHRFADHETIPDWAKDHVHAAARWGLITGFTDGSFQPTNDTTRAEAVTLLERLLDQVSE